MWSVVVRSRIGNFVLFVVGIVYALAATVLLVSFIVRTWGAASRADLLMQVMLMAAAACGAWFAVAAMHNLGLRRRARAEQRHAVAR